MGGYITKATGAHVNMMKALAGKDGLVGGMEILKGYGLQPNKSLPEPLIEDANADVISLENNESSNRTTA